MKLSISKAGKSALSNDPLDLIYSSAYSAFKIRSTSSGIAHMNADDAHSGFDVNANTLTPDGTTRAISMHFIGIKGDNTTWATQYGCYLHPGAVVGGASVFSAGNDTYWNWKVYRTGATPGPVLNIPIRTVYFYDNIDSSQPAVSDLTEETAKISISKAGEEVLGATSKAISMSSKYKNLEIHTIGETTMTTSKTIAHNLGYVPICLAFLRISADKWYQGSNLGLEIGGMYDFQYCMDSTNLYVYTNSPTTDTIKYIIFKDKII